MRPPVSGFGACCGRSRFEGRPGEAKIGTHTVRPGTVAVPELVAVNYSRGVTLQIGLTGNIGSGKSTVARLLEARGAAAIDADRLSQLATEDPEILACIAEEIGPELLVGGRLDRARTAERVFADEVALRALNAIVHPWVWRARAERVAALQVQPDPPGVVIHDIPLLFETGLEEEFDGVVVVDAPLESRIVRVMARGDLSPDEIRLRDAAQLPLAHKVERADYVVTNDHDLEALASEVDRLWNRLLQRAVGADP